MKNPNDLNLTPGDTDAAESLRRAIEAETPVVEEQQEVAAPAVVEPNPFLVSMIGGLVAKGLDLSKAAGWSTPAVDAAGLTEDKWKQTVTECTSRIVARRFPRLNQEVSEEFTLLVLVGPWLIINLFGMFLSKKKEKALPVVEAPAAA